MVLSKILMTGSALFAGLALSLSGARADVSLNGDWKLEYFPQPDDGAVRTLPLPAGLDVRSVAATVPGNCELDLVRAGILPEPEVGLNVLKLRDYEGHQWLYSRTFLKPALRAGEQAVLRFEGIDTLADIFLNGEKIGETENMLIAHEFNVTRRLKDGANTVQVLLRSVRCEAQYQTVGALGHSVGSAGADGEPFRKASHMGGWDIFPRAFVSGLWRDVSLDVRKPARIDQPFWMVHDLNVAHRYASLTVTCRVQAPFRTLGHAKLRHSILKDGRTVSSREQPFDRYLNCAAYWRVNDIDPWWPKGMGPHTLYDARIELVGEDGTVLASRTDKIGFRTIRLEYDDIYSAERPGQFLFRVNGEPCYIRGSNWVPLDSFHARDAGRVIPTLEMFDDLNCNMIRVWGGGVYEPDAFFDFCDAHGIMVWQDFMTGCSIFPQNDAYAKATADEVRAIALRFRNRASLALWSGNNENDGAYTWKLGHELGSRIDPNRERNSRRTIPDVLWEFDPTRDYLPSSPYISPDVFAKKAVASENHLWGARAAYKVPFYTNAPCHFASEMGYHGCTGRRSLERMMTKANLYPWTKVTGKNPKKDYHWNDEWLLKASDPRVGDFGFNRNSLMTNQVKLMFDEVPTDLDDFIFASQVVQAEAMKTFVEVFRSQKFKGKNGLIWWNVRDGWPQISDAVVDYYGEKKRAYYSIRNSHHDQLVLVRDNRRAYAVNDTLKPVRGRVKITDHDSGRTVLETSYDVPANAAVEIGLVSWQGQGVLDIVYEQDGEKRRNWFLYGEPPFDLKKIKALADILVKD